MHMFGRNIDCSDHFYNYVHKPIIGYSNFTMIWVKAHTKSCYAPLSSVSRINGNRVPLPILK